MDYRDEPFSPDTVDEHIEQMLGTVQSPEQAHTLPAQMVRQIQALYGEDPRLRNVWERLTEHMPATSLHEESGEEQAFPSTIVRSPQERVHIMHTHNSLPAPPREPGAFQRRLGLLVATILTIALVGSLATVFQLARQKSGGQTGGFATPTAQTSTPRTGSKPGQVIYSATLTNQEGYVPLWSADGRRIAVVGDPTLIWDATTGKHQITVPSSPSPLAPSAWSPTDERLAIATTESILVVNGLNGQVITRYPLPAMASTITDGASGGRSLSAFMPLGGAPNFGGVAWSPDGTLLASTFTSAMADGLVQVWNPRTGAVAFTLAKQAGYGYGNIAWSGDGHYIAAMAWSWTGGAEQINVWSVQTHQVVFQQVNAQGFSGVTWQPGTDNLASALLIPGSDSNLPGPPVYNTAILKVWNVMTKQVLASLQGIDGSSLAWSPDGKHLAYASIVNPNTRSTVAILDVQSGQKLYTYIGSVPSDVSFGTPAWSPDGNYIATIASRQDFSGTTATPTAWPQSGVVQVWVA